MREKRIKTTITIATKVKNQGAPISPTWVTMNKRIAMAIMLKMVILIVLIHQ